MYNISMNFKVYINYVKLFLFSKWRFELPKKNKYLVFDGNYNPFTKYVNVNDITVLYRRGEEINIPILLKCIFFFNLNSLEYFKLFIKYVSPKFILTAFDYHTSFYKLSEATGVRTIMLQKGQRGVFEDIYINKNNVYFSKNSKKKFFVDYMFLFNDYVKKFYAQRIRGKIFSTGSFENNLTKRKNKKIKKEVVFISNYNHKSLEKKENEDVIAYFLAKISYKEDIKFNILPRYRKNSEFLKEEIKFYKNKIPKNVNFLTNTKISSYDILKNYKYIFASYSTLASETLSKGYRVGFVMYKSKTNSILQYRLGNYQKKKKSGKFWTTFHKLNEKEIYRVFEFVIKSKIKVWNRIVINFRKEILSYEFDNKTFKKILFQDN